MIIITIVFNTISSFCSIFVDISNLPPVKSLAEVMNDIEAVHEQLKYLLTCKISETYKRVFGWNRLRQLNMKISTLLRIDIHTNGHTIGYKNDNKLCNGEADHPDIASHSNNETNRNLEGNAKMNGDNLDECKIVEKKHSNGINLQIPFGHEIGITPFEERQNGYESTFPSMKLFHESMMSSR